MEFLRPKTVAAALETMAQYGHDAKVIAGGTAVVLMLQQKLFTTDVLVSLEHIPALDDIRSNGGGLHIGPMARLRDVSSSPLVQKKLPGLAHACAQVGNVRIQNQATLGGNLAEADYASDPPSMLLALNASVTAASSDGTRQLPLTEFFQGFYATALQPGELITDIFVPTPPAGARMTYRKFRSRSSEDRPCVGVAALAAFDGDVCTELRVAIGAATETPQRLSAIEDLAGGQPLTNALIAEIAEGYAAALEPLDDLRGSAWYRTQMIRVHIRRALLKLSQGGA